MVARESARNGFVKLIGEISIAGLALCLVIGVTFLRDKWCAKALGRCEPKGWGAPIASGSSTTGTPIRPESSPFGRPFGSY